MGPEPTIRMRWMSVRRGIRWRLSEMLCEDARETGSSALEILHQLHEVVEEIVRIVRSGRRFRMILDAKHGLAAMAKTFEGVVIQIDVSQLDILVVQ